MNRLRLATCWLDGCSGCHMSLLDTDERLLKLIHFYVFVYSPLMDIKAFPENVDVVCIEGAVSTNRDLETLQTIRQRSGMLIAMGDCAVTGNIPGMRNVGGAHTMLHTVYGADSDHEADIPSRDLPTLLDKALPLHQYVPVDYFLPGCPPAADTLYTALLALAQGERPCLNTRFGA